MRERTLIGERFQSSAAGIWEPSAQNVPGGIAAVQAAEKASIL